MPIRLQQILSKLAELREKERPSRHDISRDSGIDIHTVTRIFAIPQTKLPHSDFEKLIMYLFREFRPHIVSETKDQELINHLRYELIDFQCAGAGNTNADVYRPDQKYTLKDVFF